MTFAVIRNTMDSNEAVTAVLLRLLDEHKMRQYELAPILQTSEANVSLRIKTGSMKVKMIQAIDKHFKVDFMSMVNRYQSGESLDSIFNPISNKSVEVDFQLTPEEVKQVIMNQGKTIQELRQTVEQLVGQISTWIEHDVQKSLKQEEIINTLMEERAEYKSKKK